MVADALHLAGLAQNIAALHADGFDVVVVHGGGPQVTALQATLGQTAHKVAGQRVTSADDIFAVTSCLAGSVNVQLCAALLAGGVPAFGCHGASGALVRAVKRPPLEVPGHGIVDYGEVGDVVDVNAALVEALWAAGQVPVIATLGIEADTGRVLNVNGDVAAAAIALAVEATLVVMVTAVGGVFRDHRDPATRLPALTLAEARGLIADGVIRDGMVPKVEEALRLLERGVPTVGIASGLTPQTFARLAAGDVTVGTRLIADGKSA